MGVRLYSNKINTFQKVTNEEKENKKQLYNFEKEEQQVLKKETQLKSYDVSSSELMSNYSRAGLKINSSKRSKIDNGHSRYEYKGARFDIYRREDKYKSQFVYPKDYDTQEFIDKFPELESQPILQADSKSSSLENINGEIDETISQSSNTGDCWLITAVVSMANTEKGKEIIKNSIKVNDDNTVTVSFRGIGVSYTLTQAEIEKYDTDSKTYDSYSNGDNDMLVLELAAEKLWKDINSGKVKLDTNDENLTYTGEGYGIDDGGLPSQMVYYLTGIESKEYYYEDGRDMSQAQIYKILENALKSDNTVMDIGIYDNVHSCKLTDGSTFSLDVGNGGHALAVTKITSDTVTFVNPWDTSVEYTASWSEFASLGIGYISSADLNEAEEKEIVYDGSNTADTEPSQDYSDRYNPYSDYGSYNYGYDYGYNYGYDSRPGRYDYGYDYDRQYGDFEPKKPDFDDEKSLINDFDDESYSYSSSSTYFIAQYLMEFISEMMNMLKSLFSSMGFSRY